MFGGKYQIKWMLTCDTKFTIRSLYLFLAKAESGFPHKFLWKTKIPSKIYKIILVDGQEKYFD